MPTSLSSSLTLIFTLAQALAELSESCLTELSCPAVYLWPGQWCYIFRFGTTWVVNPRDTRWKPGVAVTFFVDPVLGQHDGLSDGLATGAGAVRTIAAGIAAATARVDYGGILVSNAGTVQLAPGTYTEVGYN